MKLLSVFDSHTDIHLIHITQVVFPCDGWTHALTFYYSEMALGVVQQAALTASIITMCLKQNTFIKKKVTDLHHRIPRVSVQKGHQYSSHIC